MELHQLRYLVAVVEAGSFSRAAERCYVSQPSLSQQIAKLERALGQQLLVRLGRRVLPTDAGRLLAERAAAILAAVDDTERQLTDAASLRGGRLAVGAIPTVAPYLLPPVLSRFLGRQPDVELVIREDVTRQLVPATAAGDLDLAIIALPAEDERLHAEALLTERLLLVTPHGHHLSRKRRVTLDDLREEPFILLNEEHCLGQEVLSFCRSRACQPRIVCRTAQIATVQALIALGRGVSLLPEMARRADGGPARVYRPLAEGGPQRTLGAVWHRNRYHSPAAERFLATLRSYCAVP
jgi:LysR family hydrogen peroxide-inducible transcriptional activator